MIYAIQARIENYLKLRYIHDMRINICFTSV